MADELTDFQTACYTAIWALDEIGRQDQEELDFNEVVWAAGVVAAFHYAFEDGSGDSGGDFRVDDELY